MVDRVIWLVTMVLLVAGVVAVGRRGRRGARRDALVGDAHVASPPSSGVV